jgi:hypothetical protein
MRILKHLYDIYRIAKKKLWLLKFFLVLFPSPFVYCQALYPDPITTKSLEKRYRNRTKTLVYFPV